MHLQYRLSCAEVVELADAQRSGRCGPRARAGSTPAFGTIQSIGPLKLRLAGVEVVFTMLLYGLGDLYVGWQKVVIEQVLNLHPLVHVMYC